MILIVGSEGPDQIARMRSLIWAFAVRLCQKTRFRMARPVQSEDLEATIRSKIRYLY